MTVFNYYFHFTTDGDIIKNIHEEIKNLKIVEWLQEYDISLVINNCGFFIQSNELLFMKNWDRGISLGIYREPCFRNDVWDIEAIPEAVYIFSSIE